MELHIEHNILLGFEEATALPENFALVIPDTVTEIAPKAFFGCGVLSSVVFPASVKKIGDDAFYGAFTWDTESLYKTITDWDDETQFIPYIEDIVFPTGLRKIGARAFAGVPCRKIVLPEGLEALGEEAFHESDMLELVIPGSLKSIAKGAFRECGQLQSVQINTGVERICEEAFFRCEKLRTLDIQPGLKTIETNAFFRCSALTELVLPEGLLELEDMAFQDCGRLERVVFPSTLKCIGSDPHIPDIWPAEVTGDDEDRNEGVFSLCSNLSEVVIPEGVEKIGYEAFWNTGLHMCASELPSTIKQIHGRCGLFWDKAEWDKGLIWGEEYFVG